MYTLDTNIIIYFLKGETSVVNFLDTILSQETTIYISAVTEAELFSFSKLSPYDEQEINNILNTLSIISLDSRLARMTGFLRRKYRIKMADAVIASTALFTGSTLLTWDIKDFKRITELKLQKI